MRYSGIQPQYFPRLHYFARILQADIFMIRDDCQFVRSHKYPDGKRGKSYQAHSPIKLPSGIYYLNVPVIHAGNNPIMFTQLSNNIHWGEDHLRILKAAYAKSKNFSLLYPELEQILVTKYNNVAKLNTTTIFWGILRILGFDKVTLDMLNHTYVNKKLRLNKKFRLKKIVFASQTETFTRHKNFIDWDPNEKIIALCREFHVTEDYCGNTALDAYMDTTLFKKNGIKISSQNWKCQEYPQQFLINGFIPNLSIIDLLMNISPAEAEKIIKG